MDTYMLLQRSHDTRLIAQYMFLFNRVCSMSVLKYGFNTVIYYHFSCWHWSISDLQLHWIVKRACATYWASHKCEKCVSGTSLLPRVLAQEKLHSQPNAISVSSIPGHKWHSLTATCRRYGAAHKLWSVFSLHSWERHETPIKQQANE